MALFYPCMKIKNFLGQKFFFILGLYNFLAYLECVRSYAWSKGHSDLDLSSVYYYLCSDQNKLSVMKTFDNRVNSKADVWVISSGFQLLLISRKYIQKVFVIPNIILNGIYLFVSPPEDFVVFEPEDEPGAVVKVKLSTGDLHLGDASLLP